MDPDLQDKLDYSPLVEPVNSEDIKYVLSNPAKNGINPWVFSAMLVLSLGVFALIVLLVIPGILAGGFPVTYLLPFALALYPFVQLYMIVNEAHERMKINRKYLNMQNFAVRNGMRLLQNVQDPDFDARAFDQNASTLISNAYVLPGPAAVEIGNYYIPPSEASSGYVKIRLPRRLPNIVLYSTLNSPVSSLYLPYASSQRLELESNFNKYFEVYAPEEYKRDALYILTPDIMQMLMEMPMPLNVEIIEDKLYLQSSLGFQLNSESELRQLILIAKVFMKEFTEEAEHYRDSSAQVQFGQATADTNVVAPTGRRLKSKNPIIWFIVAILAMPIFMYLMIRISVEKFSLLLPVVMAVVWLPTKYISDRKKARLEREAEEMRNDK